MIKNIVFDLGGVIMNLNVLKTIKAFQNIGIENIVNNTGHHYTDPIFYDFEIGDVSESDFIGRLAEISTQNPSIEEIKRAWNAMILNMPKGRVDLIVNLKKKYNIFLLSNTNSIHQSKFENEFKNQYSYNFSELFKKIYYSHQIGMRKPNEEIFHFLLEDSKLISEETLFVDDAVDNILSAQKTGMEAFHIENYNVIDVLKRLHNQT